MILQTQIPIKKQQHNLIDYDANILLFGSCFSDNIGNKLSYYKFQATQNPFGILFHPIAIKKLLLNIVNQKEYTENDTFFLNERWHCFDTHSNLSNKNQQELITNLNKTVNSTFNQLQSASHIVITLGTAWVYRFLASKAIVANCHKLPQKEFTKEIIAVNTVEESLKNCHQLIRSLNKKASIIFTISPVRHLKDGYIENKRSKSHLISGIHQFLDSVSDNTFYFPSYEIMMDELRDYRFYTEDMIHPNKIAINYIWQKFIANWFTENCLTTMKKVEEVQKRLTHKPFNPDSEAHQKFLKNLAQKKEALLQAFPFMKF